MLEQNLVQERCQSSDPGTAGRNEWVGGHTEFPLSECQVLFARGLTRPSVNRITLYGRSVCLASGRHGDGTRDPAKGCNFRNDSAHKKTPRTSRGVQISSQSFAGSGLLAARRRCRGHGLLGV